MLNILSPPLLSSKRPASHCYGGDWPLLVACILQAFCLAYFSTLKMQAVHFSDQLGANSAGLHRFASYKTELLTYHNFSDFVSPLECTVLDVGQTIDSYTNVHACQFCHRPPRVKSGMSPIPETGGRPFEVARYAYRKLNNSFWNRRR
jgi:hypothetical protein